MGFGVPHLYRSTTFGSAWLNISANLPNAPANAVVVDPNDANTVYLAMDAGVYVTQAITTCSTANCWSRTGNRPAERSHPQPGGRRYPSNRRRTRSACCAPAPTDEACGRRHC